MRRWLRQYSLKVFEKNSGIPAQMSASKKVNGVRSWNGSHDGWNADDSPIFPGFERKGRPNMHTPHHSLAQEASAVGFSEPREAELAYRGLTVAAILALLASLWVF
jgi:hypothetical protein